jgi:hypothetical protein
MMCGLESGVLSVTNSEEADATILMERCQEKAWDYSTQKGW